MPIIKFVIINLARFKRLCNFHLTNATEIIEIINSMNLLIVESPAKAKTIGKYLGRDYMVLSSYGHVRALPSAKGAVDPERNFKMQYEVLPKASKQIAAIIAEAKKADAIYLATDPDREGEAISWHILEILKEKKVIKGNTQVYRAVFHEITKKAVIEAIRDSRSIDQHLVQAQQTRQALDYLVGFTLSPVLWRKLPGSKSAGRVQSVALKIICEREAEIEKFCIQEYWDIQGLFSKKMDDENFSTALIEYCNKKLDKLDIKNEQEASSMVDHLLRNVFTVVDVAKKKTSRSPYAPFSTSTMIQEASRRLGFSAKKISLVAQKLYEGVSIDGELTGLITYMRTDSINISAEASRNIAAFIEKEYGALYLPKQVKVYKNKTKNAQEAHEAIRPTDVLKSPALMKSFLEDDQFKLYELIWNRTVASQMANAAFDVVAVDIADNAGSVFRTNGSIMTFQGFYRVYKNISNSNLNENDVILPPLQIGEELNLIDIQKKQHFTNPPPRYNEASLVKKMEELGIGRPSTYSTIMSILQEREYVRLENKRFTPESKGRLVNTFLSLFFTQYIEYDFTAKLENMLDDIANGQVKGLKVLQEFWAPFKSKTEEVLNIKTAVIIGDIEKILLPSLFAKDLQNQADVNLEEVIKCKKCANGHMTLRNGRFGSFLACSNYPTCDYTMNLDAMAKSETDSSEDVKEFPIVIGCDPVDNSEISIRKGPYGIYVQKGEGKTAKRASLSKAISYKNVDLQYAIGILNLPREVGMHEGTMIKAGMGKFGPFIERNNQYIALRFHKLDPVSITLEQAIEVINKKQKTPAVARKTIKKK